MASSSASARLGPRQAPRRLDRNVRLRARPACPAAPRSPLPPRRGSQRRDDGLGRVGEPGQDQARDERGVVQLPAGGKGTGRRAQRGCARGRAGARTGAALRATARPGGHRPAARHDPAPRCEPTSSCSTAGSPARPSNRSCTQPASQVPARLSGAPLTGSWRCRRSAPPPPRPRPAESRQTAWACRAAGARRVAAPRPRARAATAQSRRWACAVVRVAQRGCALRVGGVGGEPGQRQRGPAAGGGGGGVGVAAGACTARIQSHCACDRHPGLQGPRRLGPCEPPTPPTRCPPHRALWRGCDSAGRRTHRSRDSTGSAGARRLRPAPRSPSAPPSCSTIAIPGARTWLTPCNADRQRKPPPDGPKDLRPSAPPASTPTRAPPVASVVAAGRQACCCRPVYKSCDE